MAYRIVIEPDPGPDFSWLKQSSYNPASHDYDAVYAPKEMGGAVIPPEEYRDPANHAAQSIQLYYVNDDDETHLDGVGTVDYYRPFHTVPEGSWDVDGPDDLPSEWDEFTRETVQGLDWTAPSEPNVPTLYVDGEPADIEIDPDEIETVSLEFDAAINGPQSEAQTRAPLAWVNHAGINLDRQHDSVTVRISVGDPRGAFAFTVSRHPDGDLRLSVPYPGEGAPHCELEQLNPGFYRIK